MESLPPSSEISDKICLTIVAGPILEIGCQNGPGGFASAAGVSRTPQAARTRIGISRVYGGFDPAAVAGTAFVEVMAAIRRAA
jgi:hypothetical protein